MATIPTFFKNISLKNRLNHSHNAIAQAFTSIIQYFPREIDRIGQFRAATIVLPAETLSQHLLILVFRGVSIKSIPREIDRIGQFRAAPNGLPVGLQRVCSRLRSAAQRQPQDARTIGFPSLNR